MLITICFLNSILTTQHTLIQNTLQNILTQNTLTQNTLTQHTLSQPTTNPDPSIPSPPLLLNELNHLSTLCTELRSICELEHDITSLRIGLELGCLYWAEIMSYCEKLIEFISNYEDEPRKVICERMIMETEDVLRMFHLFMKKYLPLFQ